MIMLMVSLLQAEQTTKDFFQDVIFEQNVKTKKKQFSMQFIKTDDFWKVLQEQGIRSKSDEHVNLREFLQLNKENPGLILLKNVRKTLELLAEDEQIMDSIQNEIIAKEE